MGVSDIISMDQRSLRCLVMGSSSEEAAGPMAPTVMEPAAI